MSTPETPTHRHPIAWLAKAARVRLRFILVLAGAAVIVGGWETWRTYWDRWILAAKPDSSLGAVSADTEYFCPMDPGVLSDWSGKCPVCNMALVRRAKGDMTPLPTGVVARVQLAPNRVQMAGIRTSAVGFQALDQTLSLVGTIAVEGDRLAVVAAIDGADRSALKVGSKAEVVADPWDGRDSLPAKLLRVEGDRAIVALDDPAAPIRVGAHARATIHLPVSEIEPFRSLPDEAPPRMPKEPRSLYVCGDHPSVARIEPGTCPQDGNPLMSRPVAKDQRVRWWCPMHSRVTAETSGAKCDECGGMSLIPRIVTYRPKGQVLTIPESAVIDTGTRRVVYVESMPGTFDGVEVILGPRCGGMFPVVSGLEPGQKVATSGAFLIDAETRLNPALAAGYFGASRPAASVVTPATSKLHFSGLSEPDRVLAVMQKTCPVTKKPLGSMGSPVRVKLADRIVFVCCEGCVETLTDKPETYLKPSSAPAHHP